jgi:hypothetical protein
METSDRLTRMNIHKPAGSLSFSCPGSFKHWLI